MHGESEVKYQQSRVQVRSITRITGVELSSEEWEAERAGA